MKTENRLWSFLAFLIALSLIMLCAPAWATKPPPRPPGVTVDADSRSSSESSVKNTVEVGTNVEVGGPVVDVPVTVGDTVLSGGDNNVSIEGDKSRAYALGMASGTIADCMAHWAIAIVSWPARNKFCERLAFTAWAENPARHTLNSVKIHCSSRIAKEIFGKRKDCETAFVTVEPPDAHQEQISVLVAQNNALSARIDALESRLSASEAALKEKARKATLEARYAVREAQQHPEVAQYQLSEEQTQELDEWRSKFEVYGK